MKLNLAVRIAIAASANIILGKMCLADCGQARVADCLCEGVDCSNLDDQCTVGVCADGTCSAVPKPKSTSCDDGNACTNNDSCDGDGQCVGAEVDCSDLDDQCNDGVCDPQDGTCSAVPKPKSTSCDDGDACTKNDSCDGKGQCVGDDIPGCPDPCAEVDCSNLDDQCNDGVCADGTCSAVPKPASTPCNDGDACTNNDSCDGQGQCVGDDIPGCPDLCAEVDCSDLDDQCNDGVCDPADGTCSKDPKDASTFCDDGNACTSFGGVPGATDSCDGQGQCAGDPVDNCPAGTLVIIVTTDGATDTFTFTTNRPSIDDDSTFSIEGPGSDSNSFATGPLTITPDVPVGWILGGPVVCINTANGETSDSNNVEILEGVTTSCTFDFDTDQPLGPEGNSTTPPTALQPPQPPPDNIIILIISAIVSAIAGLIAFFFVGIWGGSSDDGSGSKSSKSADGESEFEVEVESVLDRLLF